MTNRSARHAALVIGAAVVTCGLLGSSVTTAGFQDRTFATATLMTAGMPAVPPVFNDQTFGSALFLDEQGRLFVSGYRGTGDGNGGAPAATDPPTLVDFGNGARIVEAAGSTNDFSTGFANTTSFMARDSEGTVWTWGRVWNSTNLIGRGALDDAAARTVGPVETGLDEEGDTVDLPPIIDMERAENQFYALDASGDLWTWGYIGQNLPRFANGNNPTASAAAGRPMVSNWTRGSTLTARCTDAVADCAKVTWHSIWGGNNGSFGVATNGLIYTWGFDTGSDGAAPNQTRTTQRFPRLDHHANRVLFEAYPGLYVDDGGDSLADGAAFDDIVDHMLAGTLEVCATPIAKETVDTSECPVRQLGLSARAPRLLLQNGDLYTWRISTTTHGTPFLGRPVANQTEAGTPTRVLSNVDYTTPGISAVTALRTDGTVWGWGTNTFCQAIGSGSAPCASGNSETITLPTRIDVPGAVAIRRVSATQCATWVQSADGRMWAWGAGLLVGTDFRTCTADSSAGGRIFNFLTASADEPFGERIAVTSTGLIQVR